jgi:hypothetical protein
MMSLLQNLKGFRMDQSFNTAYIGIPKSLSKDRQATYTQLSSLRLSDYLKSHIESVPTIFYLNGSAGFTKGEVYRKWVVENTGCLFFSPNDFAISGRPTYSPRSRLDEYETVHRFRQDVIRYNINKLLGLGLNLNPIFLMGNSEGALAAGVYPGREFFGRIILAWGCESGYYTSHCQLGAAKDDPILAIIGDHDEYFSKQSKKSIGHNINGSCQKQLQDYKNAINITLPMTGHNLTENPYTELMIVNFINFWKLRC